MEALWVLAFQNEFNMDIDFLYNPKMNYSN